MNRKKFYRNLNLNSRLPIIITDQRNTVRIILVAAKSSTLPFTKRSQRIAAITSLLIGISKIRFKDNYIYLVNQITLLITMISCYQFIGLYIADHELISLATDNIKVDSFALGMKLLISTLGFVYFLYGFGCFLCGFGPGIPKRHKNLQKLNKTT